MERIQNMVLIIGIIFLSCYTMKICNDTVNQIERMNQQIQMMFVKS